MQRVTFKDNSAESIQISTGLAGAWLVRVANKKTPGQLYKRNSVMCNFSDNEVI